MTATLIKRRDKVLRDVAQRRQPGRRPGAERGGRADVRQRGHHRRCCRRAAKLHAPVVQRRQRHEHARQRGDCGDLDQLPRNSPGRPHGAGGGEYIGVVHHREPPDLRRLGQAGDVLLPPRVVRLDLGRRGAGIALALSFRLFTFSARCARRGALGSASRDACRLFHSLRSIHVFERRCRAQREVRVTS